MSAFQQQSYTANTRPGFLGDFLSRDHLLAGGIKLSTAGSFLPADDHLVTTTGAKLKAATTLPVATLDVAIPNGTVLNFGARTEVVATVSIAVVSVGATAIPVMTLDGPIPNDAVLDFGGTKFARLSAAVAAAATSIPVDALGVALAQNDDATYESETVLEAKLAADAAIGDTVITVSALDDGIASGAVARYTDPSGFDPGKGIPVVRVPAGTVVYAAAATYQAGGDTGVNFLPAGPGTVLAGTEIVYILAQDVLNLLDNNDAEALRAGTLIFENFLPNWSTLDASVKTLVRAKYECVVSASGQEVAST